MVAMPRPRLALSATLALLLAGCAGGGAGDAGEGGAGQASGAGGAPDAGTDALVVEGLRWQVGQSWSHHWMSPANGLDFTVRSIVVGNESGAYTVATDDRLIAGQHAAFFFMDLGRMQDGTMSAGPFAFPWYDFPLTHNKTWTATETNVGDGFEPVSRSVTYTARQVGTGAAAHFAIEGMADGKRVVAYDYDPKVGWFREYQSYYVPEGGEPEPAFRIVTEAQEAGYTGPYFDATGDLLVSQAPLMHPGATPEPAGALSFGLEAAHTDVVALLFSFAAGGAQHAELVAPDGQHWEATGAGDPDGNNPAGGAAPVPSGQLVLTPAQDGEWKAAWAGAGVVAGGGVYVWGATITEGTL